MFMTTTGMIMTTMRTAMMPLGISTLRTGMIKMLMTTMRTAMIMRMATATRTPCLPIASTCAWRLPWH